MHNIIKVITLSLATIFFISTCAFAAEDTFTFQEFQTTHHPIEETVKPFKIIYKVSRDEEISFTWPDPPSDLPPLGGNSFFKFDGDDQHIPSVLSNHSFDDVSPGVHAFNLQYCWFIRVKAEHRPGFTGTFRCAQNTVGFEIEVVKVKSIFDEI